MENQTGKKLAPKNDDQRMLTGMFNDRESTENACTALQKKGYTKEEINLVMSDDTRKKHFSGDVKNAMIGFNTNKKATQDTGKEGKDGADTNKPSGGVMGELVGAGVSEERAKLYESGINKGSIVVRIRPHNDEDAKFFEHNWKENKGVEIHL